MRGQMTLGCQIEIHSFIAHHGHDTVLVAPPVKGFSFKFVKFLREVPLVIVLN